MSVYNLQGKEDARDIGVCETAVCGHRPWLLFLAGAVHAAVGRAVPRAGGGHRLSDTADTVVRRRASFRLCRMPCGGETRRARLRDAAPCGGRPHLRSNHAAAFAGLHHKRCYPAADGDAFRRGDSAHDRWRRAARRLLGCGRIPLVACLFRRVAARRASSSRASAAWGQYRLCCA